MQLDESEIETIAQRAAQIACDQMRESASSAEAERSMILEQERIRAERDIEVARAEASVTESIAEAVVDAAEVEAEAEVTTAEVVAAVAEDAIETVVQTVDSVDEISDDLDEEIIDEIADEEDSAPEPRHWFTKQWGRA